MQPRVTISAVIITLNEEKNIERCIQSLLAVADEIIVWDAFSTDQTKALSESMGAVVYQQEWAGYSKSKNQANDKATGHYILSIDADEELSPELRKTLLAVKQSLTADAYVFTRLTNYCGTWIRHSGWYPEYKIRLFKKNSAFWVGEIHEYLEFVTPVQPAKIKGDLLHYSIRSIEHHMEKIFLYSRLAAMKDYQRGLRPSVVYNGILKPTFHFFKNYVIQLGFTGGYYGFVIAKMAAFERFLRYAKLKQLIRENQQSATLRVVQLSSESTWRGGEQQIAYLIGEMQKQNADTIAVVKKGSSFEKHCRENAIKYYRLPFKNSIDIFTAWSLVSIARKEKANLVHIHSSKSHTIAVIATLFGLNKPLVLSRRVDFELSDTIFSKWKYNHSAIKKILCVSNAINLIVRPHLKHPEKCITVYSGIDLTKFSSRPTKNLLRSEFNIDENTVLIGNTSALAPHKDYFTFIDTIALLVAQKANIKGFIIGKGELEKELRDYVDQKQLTDHIIFTGFRNDIKKILPCLDIFLITSNEEGLGTSVLDAFACRIPVVATSAGGIPEMVINGVTGVLCTIGDAKGLSQGIERIMIDPDFRTLIVHNANEICKKFSKEQMATKTIDVYREVLAIS